MDYELFQEENEVLERATALLSEHHDAGQIATADFEFLLKNYRKNLRDIRRLVKLSDRNQLQLNKAKAEAIAATEAKATFLAVMSHEIRTPMNGVLGMIEMLNRSDLDSDQQQMLQTVQESARSLLAIINDILDFSKIEAGKLELEILPVRLEDLLEGVGDSLAISGQLKSVVLNCYCDPDIPPLLQCDATRIRQILFNFGSNAVKFTEAGGSVCLRADYQGQDDNASNIIRIAVQDSGIGMSAEALENLFQPFTQAEQSTARRFGGTGLGLSICKQLADLMQGQIDVESEPGIGTTFALTLHLESSPPAGDEIADTEPDLNGISGVFALPADAQEAEIVGSYAKSFGVDLTVVSEPNETFDLIFQSNTIDAVIVGTGGDANLRQLFSERLDAAAATHLKLEGDRSVAKGFLHDSQFILQTHPLRRRNLGRALAQLCGRLERDGASSQRDAQSAQPDILLTVDEAEAAGRLILVAEDNLINQDVIRRQLSAIGHTFEFAMNGVEALALMQNRRYGILLTDYKMPEMDGLDLTKNIRQGEQGQRQQLPIIGITANAVDGEADACLAAGMNDYLLKPVDLQTLDQTLRQWLPDLENAVGEEKTQAHEKDADSSRISDPASCAPPIDLAKVVELLGGMEDLAVEMLQDSLSPAQDNLAELNAALAVGDAAEISAKAHKIKSAAGYMAAEKLTAAAQKLEDAGRAGEKDSFAALATEIHDRMTEAADYIKAL